MPPARSGSLNCGGGPDSNWGAVPGSGVGTPGARVTSVAQTSSSLVVCGDDEGVDGGMKSTGGRGPAAPQTGAGPSCVGGVGSGSSDGSKSVSSGPVHPRFLRNSSSRSVTAYLLGMSCRAGISPFPVSTKPPFAAQTRQRPVLTAASSKHTYPSDDFHLATHAGAVRHESRCSRPDAVTAGHQARPTIGTSLRAVRQKAPKLSGRASTAEVGIAEYVRDPAAQGRGQARNW